MLSLLLTSILLGWVFPLWLWIFTGFILILHLIKSFRQFLNNKSDLATQKKGSWRAILMKKQDHILFIPPPGVSMVLLFGALEDGSRVMSSDKRLIVWGVLIGIIIINATLNIYLKKKKKKSLTD